ncbi:mCG145120, partial [Mus musculus]
QSTSCHTGANQEPIARYRDLPDLQTETASFHQSLESCSVHLLSLPATTVQLSKLPAVATISNVPAFLAWSQHPYRSLDMDHRDLDMLKRSSCTFLNHNPRPLPMASQDFKQRISLGPSGARS